MISWLNKLRKMIEAYEKDPPSGMPWNGIYRIKREYQDLLDYVKHHYILTDLGSEGWYAEKKPNWRATCIECGSHYVIDGQRCGMCHDGL